MEIPAKYLDLCPTIPDLIDGFSLQNLYDLGEEIIIQLGTTGRERAILKLLYINYIVRSIEDKKKSKEEYLRRFVKDYRGRILSAVFSKDTEFSGSAKQHITKIIEAEKDSLYSQYEVIDVSNNYLGDIDIKYIYKLCSELGNTNVLILTRNNIDFTNTDILDNFRRLVEKANYIDIREYPLYIGDIRDPEFTFLKHLNERELSSIIWLKFPYYKNKGKWTNLVNEKDIDLVIATHDKFYNLEITKFYCWL